MNLPLIMNVLVFVALIILLAKTSSNKWSLSKKSSCGSGRRCSFWAGIKYHLWYR